jgi:hypothetical protein
VKSCPEQAWYLRNALQSNEFWQRKGIFLCWYDQGREVQLSVRQDTGQLHFASVPGSRRPRHAYIPRWHFDMVLDRLRNDAYEKAIRTAIEFKRGMGAKEVSVLDMGAGSGILSLLAARCAFPLQCSRGVHLAPCGSTAQPVLICRKHLLTQEAGYSQSKLGILQSWQTVHPRHSIVHCGAMKEYSVAKNGLEVRTQSACGAGPALIG